MPLIEQARVLCLWFWDARKNHGDRDGFSHQCVRLKAHPGRHRCECGVVR